LIFCILWKSTIAPYKFIYLTAISVLYSLQEMFQFVVYSYHSLQQKCNSKFPYNQIRVTRNACVALKLVSRLKWQSIITLWLVELWNLWKPYLSSIVCSWANSIIFTKKNKENSIPYQGLFWDFLRKFI
jgi:hypothetical protein